MNRTNAVKVFASVLLACCVGLQPAEAASKKLKVFILAGQSNMVGHCNGHTMGTLFNADGPKDQTLIDLVFGKDAQVSKKRFDETLALAKQLNELTGGVGDPKLKAMNDAAQKVAVEAKAAPMKAALDAYTGRIVAVSHDRYFLDRVAGRLLVLGTDELGNRCLGRTEFVGTAPVYTAYAEQVRRRVEAEQQRQQAEAQWQKRQRVEGQDEPRGRTPEALRRFNKYSVEQLEEMILELEHELDQMKERFGDEMIYKDPDRLAELQEAYNAQQAELDLLYRAYDRRTG